MQHSHTNQHRNEIHCRLLTFWYSFLSLLQTSGNRKGRILGQGLQGLQDKSSSIVVTIAKPSSQKIRYGLLSERGTFYKVQWQLKLSLSL